MPFTLENHVRCSVKINGHQSTCTIMNSDLVPIHTKFHRLPFQECWSMLLKYEWASVHLYDHELWPTGTHPHQILSAPFSGMLINALETWMGTSPLVWSWTLTYWYPSTPNSTSSLFRNADQCAWNMNGHQSTCMIMNSDLTGTHPHQITSAPFSGLLVNPVNTQTPWHHPNQVHCQIETEYKLVLQSSLQY